jgi:peptidoglycan/xylan/chitin deacetylase (PgdA/CDA1 family)
MRLKHLKRTLVRHLMMKDYEAYEQVLKHIKAHGDIWMTSQGEYMAWWREREKATLRVTVSNGICRAESSLENAAFEKFPGGFVSSQAVRCGESTFSGEVWLTVDSTLEKKELLIEILKREGSLNFRVAREGDFFLCSQEMAPLLSEIDAKLRERRLLFEADISAVRQLVVDKLAECGLPLLRIWYHPIVDGTIIKAVFSPRYDVDRAITNLARVRALEQKYGVTSTLYLRAFCPFYSDRDIKALASSGWCTEIGLHGEFVRNARRYGDEFSAARAEKEHLEKLIERPVTGLCMHGGELASNVSENTWDVIERAGFLYDTTSGKDYYFPYRPTVNGQVYRLHRAFDDIKVPPGRNYARDFYEKVMEKMDKVYKQNGVFVLTLHPVYFGFSSYLFRPKNFARLARFFWSSFKRREGNTKLWRSQKEE